MKLLGWARRRAARREALRRAAERFNAGEYREAHDELHSLWGPSEGREKRFYQGLIQVAAALHHLRRTGRMRAAEDLRRSSRELLEPFLPLWGGVDVKALLEGMEAAFRGEERAPRMELAEGREPRRRRPWNIGFWARRGSG